LQGYGLTETCAGATICIPQDRNYGRVGTPLVACEIKLIDAEELGYSSIDTKNGKPYPRGEIEIRGGCVAKGYYKDDENTNKVFKEDEDGKGVWFYTGDIGMWHPDGTLEIIDRRKDLVKLKHGEYIPLGLLESIFAQCPLVESVCAHADSKRSQAVAVAVPKEKALVELAKAQGISDATNLEALCKNPKIVAEVLKSLNQTAEKAKRNKFELLGALHLSPVLWTPQSGLLTEAFKLKRAAIYKQFQGDINELYKQIAE